jgi:hypothetical protein
MSGRQQADLCGRCCSSPGLCRRPRCYFISPLTCGLFFSPCPSNTNRGCNNTGTRRHKHAGHFVLTPHPSREAGRDPSRVQLGHPSPPSLPLPSMPPPPPPLRCGVRQRQGYQLVPTVAVEVMVVARGSMLGFGADGSDISEEL